MLLVENNQIRDRLRPGCLFVPILEFGHEFDTKTIEFVYVYNGVNDDGEILATCLLPDICDWDDLGRTNVNYVTKPLDMKYVMHVCLYTDADAQTVKDIFRESKLKFPKLSSSQ